MKTDEFWVGEIVYDRLELQALDSIKRAALQTQIDSGDLILSGGEVAAPLACYEGAPGDASRLAQEEAIATCKMLASRGKRVKVIANLDVSL